MAQQDSFSLAPAAVWVWLQAAEAGLTLEEYRLWAWSESSRAEAPGGGESRLATATRYAAAYRALLGRSERTILAVLHALPIAYLLLAGLATP